MEHLYHHCVRTRGPELELPRHTAVPVQNSVGEFVDTLGLYPSANRLVADYAATAGSGAGTLARASSIDRPRRPERSVLFRPMRLYTGSRTISGNFRDVTVEFELPQSLTFAHSIHARHCKNSEPEALARTIACDSADGGPRCLSSTRQARPPSSLPTAYG